MLSVELRPGPEGVVVVSGDELASELLQEEQESCRIGASADGDEHPSSDGKELERRPETAGGGGWVRTTDNTIMSRVLYH